MLVNGRITLLFSEQLVDEFVEVALRPKFRKYFPLSDLEELMQKLRTKVEFISQVTSVELCRDSKGNFLLGLAHDGLATHLITGDKDLLVLGQVGKTKILTIADYLKSRTKSSKG
jgi:uncharacterized protein